MRRGVTWWAVVLVVACARIAAAQLGGGGGTGEPSGGFMLTVDGVLAGQCSQVDITSSQATANVSGGACALAFLGGGGGSTVLTVASCTPLQGPATIYVPLSGCEDVVAVNAETPFKSAATLSGMSCRLSGGVGAATVLIVGRKGACGSLTDDGSFSCTLNPGDQACDVGLATMALLAGQCAAIKVDISGGMPAGRALNCTVRSSG